MRPTVVTLGLVSLGGVVAIVAMAAAGPEPTWRWGYIAATASFLLSAGQMAPVLAMASRVGRGFWGAPLRRPADLLGLTGLVSAPLLLVLLSQLPSWSGRPSLWFDWPGAPGFWDALAVLSLTCAGVALVWLVTWPERRGLRWLGTPTQWRVLVRGTIGLGALYAMLLVFVHLVTVSDLGLSLVPGWHSAVIPPYHVVSGFEAAIALVVIVLAVTRRLDRPVARSCAKLLLALSLLWFYFVWCELLTYWYGRTPDEQSLLTLFMFGPGAGLFLVAILCELAVPLLVLIWDSARSNPTIIAIVSAVVVAGNFADRLRIFVGAWSVATPEPAEHLPDALAPLPMPGPLEILACAGALSLAALVMVLALGRVAAVSDWEITAVARLRPERRVLRTRTVVIARPN